jgi:hypothetical protein
MKGVNVPEPLPAFLDPMEGQSAVQLTLQHEGLA